MMDRLPSDLWTHIFHDWIRNPKDDSEQLCALSHLDVACCNRAARLVFLQLAKHCTFADVNSFDDSDGRVVKEIENMGGFVIWMTGRHIPVRTLHFAGKAFQPFLLMTKMFWDRNRSIIELPSVTNVLNQGENSAEMLTVLLRMYPNLTSFECDGDFQGQADGQLWKALAMHPARLKRLWLSPDVGSSNGSSFVADVRKCGQALEELRFADTLTEHGLTALMQSCRHLRVFRYFGCTNLTTASIIKLVNGCHALQDLRIGLGLGRHEPTDIMAILAAGQHQLKGFELFDAAVKQTCATFARLLQRCAFLEALKINEFKYSARSQGGSLFIDNERAMPLSELVAIFQAAPVGTLQVNLQADCDGDDGVVSSICQHWGHAVREVTCEANLLDMMGRAFPAVQRLLLSDAPNDSHLLSIAAHFKHLLFLQCKSFSPNAFTDIGMEALLKECKQIQELHLDVNAKQVTFRSLQAILRNRSRLRKLTYKTMGFGAADIAKFKQLAKEQKVLPVMQFVKIPEEHQHLLDMLGLGGLF